MTDQFIQDLKESVEEARGKPAGKGTMILLYGELFLGEFINLRLKRTCPKVFRPQALLEIPLLVVSALRSSIPSTSPDYSSWLFILYASFCGYGTGTGVDVDIGTLAFPTNTAWPASRSNSGGWRARLFFFRLEGSAVEASSMPFGA